ncbi:MAG: TlpA family protein disulfide reductase [Phycisphaerales bacterium]|nr:TlpA family protein disulfide reductase [Phycisphaerales bacterium]
MRKALLLGIFGLAAGQMLLAQAALPKVGAEFPNFKVKSLTEDNKEFELKDFRGKVVVVDFWATWCRPCVAEVPHLVKLYKEYHEKGLEIVSISLDQSVAKCKKFVEQNEMTWKHSCDGKGWETELVRKHGIGGIPAMFVIGRDGVIVAARARGRNLDDAIKQAIEKKPDEEKKDGDKDKEKDKGKDAVVGDTAMRTLTGEEQALAERWLKIADGLANDFSYRRARHYYELVVETFPKTAPAITARDKLLILPA